MSQDFVTEYLGFVSVKTVWLYMWLKNNPPPLLGDAIDVLAQDKRCAVTVLGVTCRQDND